jgi:peptidase E
MTKYILHGGFTSAENNLNRTFYAEIAKDVPDRGTVLLVYFAGSDEEVEGKFEQDKGRILAGANGRSLNIIIATRENFIEQVRNAASIYMRGGDTDMLQNALKEYPEFKDAIQGKTVAGSSAGAYVLSTYRYSSRRHRVRDGLGILPIKVICHYLSEHRDFQSVEDPIKVMKHHNEDLPLVVLKDYEWEVVEQS